MRRTWTIAQLGLLTLAGSLLAAASLPRALAPAEGGLWEVSRSADGHNATRICVASPDLLAQFEHRQARCTRTVLSDSGT
ncbi:MAG TPA: hypothetical protein VNJ05_00880, partial [Sphingomicrobium sp.]|nr:hypothetical protein [Sphingomicrobium sp.]